MPSDVDRSGFLPLYADCERQGSFPYVGRRGLPGCPLTAPPTVDVVSACLVKNSYPHRVLGESRAGERGRCEYREGVVVDGDHTLACQRQWQLE